MVRRAPASRRRGTGPALAEIHEEFAATTEWLAQVSPADRVRVARAGVDYAINNGPYHAWIRLCDDSLTGEMADAGHVRASYGRLDRWR